MTEIVVGVDESQGASEALRWAVREGDLRGWGVEAVMGWGYLDQHHVTPSFDPDYSEGDALAFLQELVRGAIGDEAAIAVKCVAVNDVPSRALLDAAEGAELLVVGARGLGGFAGLLLGSVSLQCLHHATTPVAIVRPRPASSAPHPPRVIVATDGSESSRSALHWAADEARLRHAQLEVVHAWLPPYLSTHPMIAGTYDPTVIEKSARKVLDDLLESEALDDLEVIPVLRFGSASEVVLEESATADLVVMGARGLGGFARILLGSVTTQVTQHATTPVVVVPAPDA